MSYFHLEGSLNLIRVKSNYCWAVNDGSRTASVFLSFFKTVLIQFKYDYSVNDSDYYLKLDFKIKVPKL